MLVSALVLVLTLAVCRSLGEIGATLGTMTLRRVAFSRGVHFSEYNLRHQFPTL